jgi:hypothetical protein
MKILLAAAFVVLVGIPSLTGVQLSTSGPDGLYSLGGGGGPAMDNKCIKEFC